MLVPTTRVSFLAHALGASLRVLALLCLSIVSLSTAATGPDNQQSFEQLLTSLPKASYKAKAQLVDQLASVNGQQAQPILAAMLAGKLYYNKAETGKLYRLSTLSDASFQLTEALSPAALSVDKKQLKRGYKKVRSNNKLRKQLRVALAKIALAEGSEQERLEAINAMLANLDQSAVELIQSLRAQESSTAVQELMDLALAAHTLATGTDKATLLAAIDTLDGSLEVAAKTALLSVTERYADDDNLRAVVVAANKSLKSIEQKTEFYGFIEKLFFGLSLGSVLLLAAIGLAITFGVMGVINMAHGEMMMLGAYTTYVVQLVLPNWINYSLWIAIPLAFLVSGLVGIVIQRGVIRHLNGRPLETLLATFGISLILQQAVRSIFSPLNRQVSSPEWMSGALEINPVLSLTYNRLYILAFSLLVFVALILIMKKTTLGLNVRAVSQNRDMAKAMGVRTEWVDAMTFGLGSGVAGVAGVALSQLTNVGPNLGQAYIIDSFMVVVFGGVGNLLGTLVGAFSLGVANKFLEPITGSVLAYILVLVFIILFIQKRPRGLFPQKGRAAE